MNNKNFILFFGCILLLVLATFSKQTMAITKCNSQLPKSLFNNQVILLGEYHGTNESPEFFYQVACQSLKFKSKVIVILEMPSDEQTALDEFFTSEKAFMEMFGQSTFWDRKFHDGRRSVGMKQLLEDIRLLKQQGNNIVVKAISSNAKQSKTNSTKAEDLFDNYKQAIKAQKSDEIIVGLFGRMHVKLIQVPDYQDRSKLVDSFGYKLAQSGVSIVALQMIHDKGTMWMCYPGTKIALDCGEKVRAVNLAKAPSSLLKSSAFNVFIYNELIDGYHGVFNVGTPTSSEPAIAKVNSRYK